VWEATVTMEVARVAVVVVAESSAQETTTTWGNIATRVKEA
jgi:hypothetical protein